VEQSKALNDLHGPFMVISASGMCEGGRVLHHLKNNIGDPRNTDSSHWLPGRVHAGTED
jgi:metallo-beta-lactamase family protein